MTNFTKHAVKNNHDELAILHLNAGLSTVAIDSYPRLNAKSLGMRLRGFSGIKTTSFISVPPTLEWPAFT